MCNSVPGLDQITFDPSLSVPMRQALLAAAAGPYERVQRLAVGGEVVWLKRAERLSLRWRLQKGDAARLLAAEEAGLRQMAALGLPVAALVATGPGLLATASAGRPLSELLGEGAAEERRAAFAAAGAALASCHQAGLVHGRPKIRDICWDGQEARFIDLERFDPNRRGARAMALDLLILLHSLLVETEAADPDPKALIAAEFTAVLTAWQAGAPEVALAALARARPMLRRLAWLSGLLGRLRPRSRELRALRQLQEMLPLE